MKIKSLDLEQLESSDLMTDLVTIDEKHLDYSWTRAQWKSLFNGDSDRYLLMGAFNEDELAGFSLFELNPWSAQAHLLKIVIRPELRGSGAASQLFHLSRKSLNKKSMCEIFLEVGARNDRAVGFYRKQGFLQLCVKKSFYSDGTDALAMLLSL
ncbi:MAG: GNAT family N-acetyltransferase [Bacteriovoracaceae bacterium]|nr:GNAT family N-acetyltransferase [Bacteriovoracaceae bacterium]